MRMKLCGCGAVKEDRRGAVCGRCGAGKKTQAKTTTAKGYGWDWQKLSERYRQQNPLCQECKKIDRATSAEEVHHIIPITEAPWLRLEVSNLMALCVECHRRIDEERRVSE